MRRKREEAGEVIRPTKKIWRKARDDPTHASEVPAEAAPTAAATVAAPTEEPGRGTPAEVPTSGNAPAETAPAEGSGEGTPVEASASRGVSAKVAPAEVGERVPTEEPASESAQMEAAPMEMGEGGQPIPTEGDAEEPLAVPAPAVVDLETEREEQAHPESAEGDEPGAGEAGQAPPESTVGEATEGAGGVESQAAPGTNGAELVEEGEEGSTDSSSSPT